MTEVARKHRLFEQVTYRQQTQTVRIQIAHSQNKISYEFKGRKRWYFPDFEIVELSRVFEIKSKWAYALNEDLNKVKIEFTKAQGIDILIVDETHGLLDNHEKLNEYICYR